MARGKAGAQAANRRLAEALERIGVLETRMAQQSAEYLAETTELRAELQRARGTTNRDVKQLADERVAEEKARAMELVKAAHDQHLSQVCEGFTFIEAVLRARGKPLSLNADEWPRLAEAFGVEFGALVAGTAPSDTPAKRWVKRLTNDMARQKLPLTELAKRPAE